MSIVLRIMLVLGSLFCFVIVIRKIKSTKLRIEASIFWIFFVLFIVFMAFFPGVVILGTNQLGVDSPVNFVYLAVLAVLILEIFALSIKLSQVENKLNSLIQQIAIREKEAEECEKTK